MKFLQHVFFGSYLIFQFWLYIAAAFISDYLDIPVISMLFAIAAIIVMILNGFVNDLKSKN